MLRPVVFFAALVLLPSAALAERAVTLQLRWTHQFQFAGYYMAQEKGFYREAGLQVRIVERTPEMSNSVAEVLAGRADFGIASSALVIDRLAGKPVVALAAITQSSPLVWLVRADSDIYSPQDLAGKRVMSFPLADSAELMTMLHQERIAPERLRIMPPSWRIEDLIENRVDAYPAYTSNEPWLLREKGFAFRTLSPREYGVNFYGDILMTRDDLIRQSPDTVAAFTRASLRGWEYALAHPEEAIAVIREKYAPEKSAEHLRFEAGTLRKLIMPELVQIGHMHPGRWEFIAESYSALGMAHGPVDLQGFLFAGAQGTDNRLAQRIAAGAVLLLLLFGAIAMRYARLSRRLAQEAALRQATEDELRRTNAALEQLASHDRLTGLWNRHRFEDFAASEIGQAHRHRHPLSLLMFDIDHFKQVNDLYGHQTGDRVLASVATLVRQQLRESDGIARWGGEEFLILAPQTEASEAVVLAEKLRQRIAAEVFPEVGRITVSFGVCGLGSGDTLATLVQCADNALYRAKDNGRNRVEIALHRPDGQGPDGILDPSILRLRWNSGFVLGIPAMDKEHEGLFIRLNQVIQAVEQELGHAEILRRAQTLIEEFIAHCDHEEQRMLTSGYPGRDDHIAAHRQLHAEAGRLIERWQGASVQLGELVEFMVRRVVAHHIMTFDRAFAQHQLARQASPF